VVKKNILFIINPISGGKDKRGFPAVADKFLDKTTFSARFEFTQYAHHAFELASSAVEAGVDIVVAVGGDGTINEVASALVSTGTIMGIVPCGSGNGLARSLNISLKTENAVRLLNRLNVDTIDTAELAGGKFFNMGGIGFDAQISYMFATMPKRGFKGYVRTTFTEIRTYRSKIYEIEVDGVTLVREAFMISLANSSQYGNNAHIAPSASLKDGLLDVCIVKPFPLRMFPVMIYHLFNRTSEKSQYVEIIKGQKIRIKSDRSEVVHLDGEPKVVTEEITAFINPLSLKIIH
jgi:diacylglycerol kinase (ATP)